MTTVTAWHDNVSKFAELTLTESAPHSLIFPILIHKYIKYVVLYTSLAFLFNKIQRNCTVEISFNANSTRNSAYISPDSVS